MTTRSPDPESHDSSIEELLREVGARAEPSTETMNGVRDAVHAEWRAMVDERRRQRRVMTWRVAASLTLAVLVATFATRFMQSDPVQVASIVYVDGNLTRSADDTDTRSSTLGQPVMTGETLQTDERSRAALSFPDGVSLRLDHATRFTVASVDRIVLTSGALYVDSPSANTSGQPLSIETHAGSVRHVGTQYLIRTHANGIDVSVREGRVVVESTRGSDTGEAGQVLHVGKDGQLTRSMLSATDPQWQWATQAAPTFDIDDQSLASFLQWIARETGRHVVYSSPRAAAAASDVKLHGSVAGLDADAALAAVLSTTRLRRYHTADDEIGIELAE